MNYMSAAEAAKLWGISERSVRNYCAEGRIPGAFLTGKTWNIPAGAEKPARKPRNDKTPAVLKDYLKREKESGLTGGIYHRVQVDLTYNSNHMEGSRLTHDQTRFIFETRTLTTDESAVRIDDILETANHFRCVDLVIENAGAQLSERLIKQLHAVLKTGTEDARKSWFAVGDYKKEPNEVGGNRTTPPEDTAAAVAALLKAYNERPSHTLEDILDFHVRFERIHPFQDGNGRIGRLIMLKECLKNNITPFIITEDLKLFYYRGLQEWGHENGYLRDTCLLAQDRFKQLLNYFRIPYSD